MFSHVVNSNNELHSNWRALSTVHIDYKVFVTPSANSDRPIVNKSKTQQTGPQISGSEAKDYYERILQTPESAKTTKKLAPRRSPRQTQQQFDRSKFFRATTTNDIETLEQMIINNKDINVTDQFGWTALMMAACAGSADATKFLLMRGADLAVSDKSGRDALQLARISKRENITQIIESFTLAQFKDQQNASQSKTFVEPFFCDVCQCNFEHSDRKQHETSTLHLFNRKHANTLSASYMIPEANRGFQLMLKQGWDKTSGLGPNENGKKYPVKTVLRKFRTGLGTQQSQARVTHFKAFDTDAIKWRPPEVQRTKREIRNEHLSEKRKERRFRKALS